MPIIDIDGARVACEDAGTGLPIVFIPGLTGSKEWFCYQFSGLRESYRIISYDTRVARSPVADTLDMLAEDLDRLLTALKLQSAVVVGFSFGAMIAQRFALNFRHRLDALVLISAFPNLPDVPNNTLLGWLSPGLLHPESWLEAFLNRIFRRKIAALQEEAEGVDWLVAHSASLPQSAIDARLSLVRQFDSTEWLSQIEAPALIIVGSEDEPQFLSGAQALYEGIPASTLEVIEGGDHYCSYAHHDIVNSAIDEFLMERLKSL